MTTDEDKKKISTDEDKKTKWRKAAVVALVCAVVVLGFVITAATAYQSGKESADRVIECDHDQVVLSLHSSWSTKDTESKLDRALTMGDCDRMNESAFESAVGVLNHNPFTAGPDCPDPMSTTRSTSSSTSTTTTTTVGAQANNTRGGAATVCVTAPG